MDGRDNWNRGVEPGSVLGPLAFILGLDDRTQFVCSILKDFFADDNFPIYSDLKQMLIEAGHFTDWILDGLMELHMSGKKSWSFVVIVRGVEEAKGLDKVTIESKYGDFKCPRVTTIKQVGLLFDIGTSGLPVCDVSSKIARLREACVALRQISRTCMASTSGSLLRTYITSVVSFNICIWYPNLFAHKNKAGSELRSQVNAATPLCTNSLQELRYWYCAAISYICFEDRSTLGWCNVSKTMSYGTSIEEKLCHLTGMPTLEELYIASCITHYRHIYKMCDLKIGNFSLECCLTKSTSLAESRLFAAGSLMSSLPRSVKLISRWTLRV